MASPRLVTGAKPAPLGAVFHDDALAGERDAVRGARQGHALRGFPTLRPRVLVAAGVAEPDQRPTAEVGNQQRHPGRAESLCEALAEDVGGGDRRRILDGHEQFGKVQLRPSPIGHRTSLRRGGAGQQTHTGKTTRRRASVSIQMPETPAPDERRASGR